MGRVTCKLERERESQRDREAVRQSIALKKAKGQQMSRTVRMQGSYPVRYPHGCPMLLPRDDTCRVLCSRWMGHCDACASHL